MEAQKDEAIQKIQYDAQVEGIRLNENYTRNRERAISGVIYEVNSETARIDEKIAAIWVEIAKLNREGAVSNSPAKRVRVSDE